MTTEVHGLLAFTRRLASTRVRQRNGLQTFIGYRPAEFPAFTPDRQLSEGKVLEIAVDLN